MKLRTFRVATLTSSTALGAVLSLAIATSMIASAQENAPTQERLEAGELPVPKRGETSYMPVIEKSFEEIFDEMSPRKSEVMERAQALLEERYDLADRPVEGVTMSGGKPVQGGVRVKLPQGVTWQQLSEMTLSEIREQGLWPERLSSFSSSVP